MAIPKIPELYNPILDYLYQYGESSLYDIRYAMAQSFYIPKREAFNSGSDKPTLFISRVNNACFKLYCAGLISRIKRGVYVIAKDGQSAIDNEDFVDSDYLWKFPSYVEYYIKRYERNTHFAANKPIPILKPYFDKPKPEYRQMEFLTIEDMVKLREQDARFANMVSSGDFLYDDGIIKSVPREVLMHDMSYAEYKATTLMHSSGQALICYQDINTGKYITAPKPTIEGYHKTQKGSRPWSNPYPPTPVSGLGGENGIGGGKGPGSGGPGGGNDPGSDGGAGGYNGNRNYEMTQKMLDFIQQSHGDFNKCFTYLMDVYDISGVMLEKKSGINRKKIQRFRNDPNCQASVKELTAIMLVLQASSYILEAFISLIGQDPKSYKWQRYCLMCDLFKFSNYEDVNARCRENNQEEIFPSNLIGPIS